MADRPLVVAVRVVVDRFGREVFDDPDRLRALLADELGTHGVARSDDLEVFVRVVDRRLVRSLDSDDATTTEQIASSRSEGRNEAAWVLDTLRSALSDEPSAPPSEQPDNDGTDRSWLQRLTSFLQLRRSIVLLTALAGLVVVAVLAALVAFSTDDPTTSADGSTVAGPGEPDLAGDPEPSDAGHEDQDVDVDELLAFVPSPLRGSCEPTDPDEPTDGALATITCRPPSLPAQGTAAPEDAELRVEVAEFTQYRTEAAALATLEGQAQRQQAVAGLCGDAFFRASTQRWSVGDEEGWLLCHADDARAWAMWTVDGHAAVGRMLVDDPDRVAEIALLGYVWQATFPGPGSGHGAELVPPTELDAPPAPTPAYVQLRSLIPAQVVDSCEGARPEPPAVTAGYGCSAPGVDSVLYRMYATDVALEAAYQGYLDAADGAFFDCSEARYPCEDSWSRANKPNAGRILVRHDAGRASIVWTAHDSRVLGVTTLETDDAAVLLEAWSDPGLGPRATESS